MNDMSPALLSRRCEQPLARLFVALIREDDACTVVRLRGQHSISSPEKSIAIPTLDQRWDISDPARWATQLALSRYQTIDERNSSIYNRLCSEAGG
jgi:hypothetical protein